MGLVTPDVSARLKPDFIALVHTIYKEFAHLQPGERVLIMSDARTPDYISAVFHGVATAFGAEVATIETKIPFGGPTYQPSAEWTPMLSAAAKEADLLIDLAVGYADFIKEAIANGARVLMPGDGVGGPYLDDMLLRTIRDVDIHEIRRTADHVAELFTTAKTCTMITGEGDELVIDLDGTKGLPADGFLWDRDKGEFKSNFAILPPAQPGVLIPRGRGNGIVSIDGTVLWHQLYHEAPRDPLKFEFVDGRLVNIWGDKYLSGRIRQWLEKLGDEGAWEGPNHLNIGINPNALLTQNQEWERVYGSVTCGMGDLDVVADVMTADNAGMRPRSKVHWDWTVLAPTIKLDDRIVLKDSRLFLKDSNPA